MLDLESGSLSYQQIRWIERLVASVFVMSVVDGILTLVWVLMHYAEEANPLMNYFLQVHPTLFMLVKIGLVALGTSLLWRYRLQPLAIAGVSFCFVVYAAILVVHLSAAGIFMRMLISGS